MNPTTPDSMTLRTALAALAALTITAPSQTDEGRTDLAFLLHGLRTQEAKGVDKYGATLDTYRNGPAGLAQHLLEERLDALMYAVALARELSNDPENAGLAVLQVTTEAKTLLSTLRRLRDMKLLPTYPTYPALTGENA